MTIRIMLVAFAVMSSSAFSDEVSHEHSTVVKELKAIGADVKVQEEGGKKFTIVHIPDSSTPLSREVLAALNTLPNLKSLTILHTGVTDEHLASIARLDQLERLVLGSWQDAPKEVTAAGMIHVAKLRRLKWLRLRNCAIGNKGVVHLASLDRLESLALDNADIDTNATDVLKSFRHLKHLSLRNADSTDLAISPIATLEDLEYLVLGDIPLNVDAVTVLKKLKKLKRLILVDDSVVIAQSVRRAIPDVTVVVFESNRLPEDFYDNIIP